MNRENQKSDEDRKQLLNSGNEDLSILPTVSDFPIFLKVKEFYILAHKLSSMQCPSEMKELLKVLYNLSGSESEVMYYLCNNEARATEIADELSKDRSTVQRYLSKLQSTGLVQRESKVEDGKKGRYYIYRIQDKKKMKEEVKQRMKQWEKEKMEVLEEI